MTTPDKIAPALIVDFGDEVGTFPAHETANQAVLVEYAEDIYAGGYASVKATIKLAQDMVLDDSQEEFAEFLRRNGRAEDFTQKLYDALEKCWSGETHLPLESSSPSSDTSSPTSGDPSSKDDSSSPDILGERPKQPENLDRRIGEAV